MRGMHVLAGVMAVGLAGYSDSISILAVLAAGMPGRPYRALNFVLSVLFLLANASHVVVTAMRAKDVLGYAQVLLLVLVIVANAQLCRISHRWWKKG